MTGNSGAIAIQRIPMPIVLPTFEVKDLIALSPVECGCEPIDLVDSTTGDNARYDQTFPISRKMLRMHLGTD